MPAELEESAAHKKPRGGKRHLSVRGDLKRFVHGTSAPPKGNCDILKQCFANLHGRLKMGLKYF